MSFESGIGTYLRNLLARGVVAGLGCDLLLLEPPGDPKLSVDAGGGAAVERVPLRAPILSPAEQWSVPLAIARGVDALWVPHFNIPLAYRGALVVTLHDLAGLDGRAPFRDLFWHAYGRLLLRTVARRANAVLCDSQFTRDAFIDFTKCDLGRTHVIPLGVAEDWYASPPGPPPHPRPYFLYVGNVKRHKNVSGLLRAYSTIHTQISHDLIIIGRIEGLRSKDDAAAELAGALGSRVVLLGTVSDDELRRYMGAATALVLPSYYEGFGLPPLEAMAMGRPAIVSRAGALPEVCGDAALYFDPDDYSGIARQLVAVANDPELAMDLARRGPARARRFAWDDTVLKTRAVLQAVLDDLPDPR